MKTLAAKTTLKECSKCKYWVVHLLRSNGRPRPWCIECEKTYNKERRSKPKEKTKLCPNCGHEGPIELDFGYRRVGLNKDISQSNCRICRNATAEVRQQRKEASGK